MELSNICVETGAGRVRRVWIDGHLVPCVTGVVISDSVGASPQVVLTLVGNIEFVDSSDDPKNAQAKSGNPQA